jgi:DNA-binding response OmpR family regulator
MLEPFEPTADEPSPPPRSVLVVIADPQLRQTIGWLLDDLGLTHVDMPGWRRAVTTTDIRPGLLIGDLDDVGKNVAGLRAVLRASWGEPIPFVLLSSRRDVTEIAAELGAAAGLCKPVDVGMLIAAVNRILPTPETQFPSAPPA